MSKRALVPVNVLATTLDPLGQNVGDTYFNSVTRSLYVWDGTTWLEYAPRTVLDILDGGDEADGTDYVTDYLDLGNELNGTDTYTRYYDAGGI